MPNSAQPCATLPSPVALSAVHSNVVPLRPTEPRVPDALKAHRQFVVWRLETITGRPKPAKVPYCPRTRQRASSTDPATWGSYGEAIAAMSSGQFNGIGFVITANDPFVFLDFDDCKDDNGIGSTAQRNGYCSAARLRNVRNPAMDCTPSSR